MATEDEIRARVEAADQSRLAARADAAIKIAAAVEKRTTLRTELAEVDAAIAAAVAESGSVMTLAELSAFTGIDESELVPAATADDSTRRGRAPRRKTAGARKVRSAIAPASPDSVAVSSDF